MISFVILAMIRNFLGTNFTFNSIDSKDFMFDFEFVSKVLKKNIWKISEVNISYKGRTFKEGKKISWLDGFRALFLILKVKIFY